MCFNTQPPEGGCYGDLGLIYGAVGFNTQPPEGGCAIHRKDGKPDAIVSTHSHPKVAATFRSVKG